MSYKLRIYPNTRKSGNFRLCFGKFSKMTELIELGNFPICNKNKRAKKEASEFVI